MKHKTPLRYKIWDLLTQQRRLKNTIVIIDNGVEDLLPKGVDAAFLCECGALILSTDRHSFSEEGGYNCQECIEANENSNVRGDG